MNDRLTAEIKRIRSDKSIQTLDEANVKQGVILRILNVLGWDPFDIEEVKPEYSVGGGNVDYSLRLDGTDKVFLEAKRPSEDLRIHQEQLLNYAFKQGVALAVLTNGLNWWLYLPLREGSWEERRFSLIELRNPDVSQTVGGLIDFLSRENVRSGTAVKNAESHLATLWKDRKIEETLPIAWKELITDPNDLLLDLLNQKVMELCGWGVDKDRLKSFLSVSLNPKPAQSFPIPLPTSHQTSMQGLDDERPPRRRLPRPVSFTFCGDRYEVKGWGEILVKLGEVIYERHPNEFDKVRTLGRWQYSGETFPKTRPKPIGDSGWFAPTNLSSDDARQVYADLLVKFGYTEQDLQIETTYPHMI